MATRRFLGGATATAQVQTYAFGGTWEIGDLIRVQIGNRIWDYAVTSATITTFLPLFVTAWNALSATTYPEFAEITTSSNSTTLTLTADAAGKPFTVTLTPLESNGGAADAQEIEGGGVATTGTTATASSGPEDWSTAANWSGGAVPVNSDDVILDMPTPIRYGLDQSAVTVATLTIRPGFDSDARLGLPRINEDGTDYPEHRDTYLKIGATTVTIDSAAPLIRLNFGSVQTACTVLSTGTSEEDGVETVLITGTNASNVLTAAGNSSVGVAVLGGETAVVATLRVDGGAAVRLGSGVTLTTAIVTGGTLETNGAATTYTLRGGDTLHRAGALTTANLTGPASLDYRSAGTLGTLTVGTNASVTFDNDPQTRTVTNCDLWAGASLRAENGTVTWSNGIDVNQCGLDDVDLRVPRNVRVTLGSPS